MNRGCLIVISAIVLTLTALFMQGCEHENGRTLIIRPGDDPSGDGGNCLVSGDRDPAPDDTMQEMDILLFDPDAPAEDCPEPEPPCQPLPVLDEEQELTRPPNPEAYPKSIP